MKVRGVRAFLLALALASFSCGGSGAPPEAPRVPPEKKPKPEAHADEPLPSRAGIECDDGSCFKCGDAVCLIGFYCSVGKSGRGCAWLPTCAGKPTCACIASSLRTEPNCACQEKEGGVYVVCDGAKL
jgi:hypothetical protein